MPIPTTHYGLEKPLVNDVTDQDLWGDELNADLDIIDSQMFVASNWVTRAVVGTDTATTADSKKLLLCDATLGAFNETLPSASTAGNGFTIAVKKTDASVNAVTVKGAGSDTVDAAASIALVTRNDSVQLVSDGISNWSSIARDPTVLPDATTSVKGVVQLATDSEFQAGTNTAKAITPSNFVNSLTSNGYARLGPFIIQWGVTASFNNTITVTFPLAFPNACLQALVSPTTSNVNAPAANTFTTTTMVIESGSGVASTQRWFAIGW